MKTITLYGCWDDRFRPQVACGYRPVKCTIGRKWMRIAEPYPWMNSKRISKKALIAAINDLKIVERDDDGNHLELNVDDFR